MQTSPSTPVEIYWNNVRVMLPTESGRYLVTAHPIDKEVAETVGPMTFILYFHEPTLEFGNKNFVENMVVTHWMFLPDPAPYDELKENIYGDD